MTPRDAKKRRERDSTTRTNEQRMELLVRRAIAPTTTTAAIELARKTATDARTRTTSRRGASTTRTTRTRRRSIEVEKTADGATASSTPYDDIERRANLILVGGRGCGKSSVCRRLAAADKRFKLFSLDDLIVYEAGMSIPEIVETRGWRYFRDLEYEVCKKAGSAFDGWTLIDAGGGVLTDLNEDGEEVYSQRKVDALKAKDGLIVFIDRPVQHLIERIQGDPNRPNLSASKGFEEIMARRYPWYVKAADFVYDAGGREDEARPLVKKKRVASAVLAWYYNQIGEKPLEDQWFQLDVERGFRELESR